VQQSFSLPSIAMYINLILVQLVLKTARFQPDELVEGADALLLVVCRL
jgi:hypothetical protein